MQGRKKRMFRFFFEGNEKTVFLRFFPQSVPGFFCTKCIYFKNNIYLLENYYINNIGKLLYNGNIENCYITEITHRKKNTSQKTWGGNEKNVLSLFFNSAHGLSHPWPHASGCCNHNEGTCTAYQMHRIAVGGGPQAGARPVVRAPPSGALGTGCLSWPRWG
jgi:hypothetical protein